MVAQSVMSTARTHIAERRSSVAKQQNIEYDETSASICNEARGIILYVYLVSAKILTDLLYACWVI